jgi:hypothetical protein
LPFDDEQTTPDFFFKIYRTFRQPLTEPNIWGAFQEAGFEFDTSEEPYHIVLNEEKYRNTREFQEIWSRDFPSKTCRQDGKMPGLVGLIAMSKNQ